MISLTRQINHMILHLKYSLPIVMKELTKQLSELYQDKQVVSFDVKSLERRGANMYNAITALAAALKT